MTLIAYSILVSGGNLPSTIEKSDGSSKTIIEYALNEDGKKVKVRYS